MAVTSANDADSVLNVIDTFSDLSHRYQQVRCQSECLVEPLSEADAQLQSMADVSPSKWHLAHTTWFFEAFVLNKFIANYASFNSSYNYLFNSYYNGIGEQYPRQQRGLISRPSLAEVIQYRHAIDDQVTHLLQKQSDNEELVQVIELGLQHEQQHQELLLTDIKHCLFHNPVFPAYQILSKPTVHQASSSHWLSIHGGLVDLGHQGAGFSYDNERPAHRVYVEDFQLASCLVTNGDYLSFIESGGYRNPDYWLADGWAWLQTTDASQPLYWLQREGEWFEFTLFGLLSLDKHQPVIHINYFEANAYAHWSGMRLPTEYEWELACRQHGIEPVVDPISVHPSTQQSCLSQAFGTAWQWTSSPYSAYPGFKPFAGAAGEYNGKFMSNQWVLRGSSCVTPEAHGRISYRNFFYPHQSWQFSGIRLAK